MDFNFEEFDESDVIFSEDYVTTLTRTQSNNHQTHHHHQLKILKNKHSVPIDIPSSNNSSPSSSFRYENDDEFDCFYGFDDDDDRDVDLVPPHLIVERRSSVDGQFKCSFEKKLHGKSGKNLIRVRNSILKLTGFLE